MNTHQTDDVISGYRKATDAQEQIIQELRAEVARLQAGGCARNQSTTQFCAEAVQLQEQMRHMVRLDDPVVTGLVEAAKAASHGNYPALGQRNASNRLCQKAISAYEAQVKSIELQNHGHIEIDYWHNNETTTMSPSRVKEVGK